MFKGLTLLQINKTSWITKLGFGAILLAAPVKMYLVTVFVLVIIDIVTGIWSSIKKGRSFKSGILMQGMLVRKVLLYLTLFILSLLLGNVFHSVLNIGVHYIAWIVTILISAYESTSIIENLVVIYPDMPMLGKLSKLINKVADSQLDEAEKKLGALKELTEDKKEESGEAEEGEVKKG